MEIYVTLSFISIFSLKILCRYYSPSATICKKIGAKYHLQVQKVGPYKTGFRKISRERNGIFTFCLYDFVELDRPYGMAAKHSG